MKVLDLGCPQGHVFEAWFASEDDYLQQRASGLLACPMCGDLQVEKKLSAPRLNLSHASAQDSAPVAPEAASAAEAPTPQAMQAAYMHVVRSLMAQTEDVGQRFAQEARAMHLGEAPERAIRGQSSAEERQALLDEGIQVLSLPVPDFAKHSLQ